MLYIIFPIILILVLVFLNRYNKNKKSENEMINLHEARQNAYPIVWESHQLVRPQYLGNKFYLEYSLEKLIN